jgi:UDP-3-O-[3-hydroxymyristoyl] glucosamine N-acyltransferase
MHLSVREIADRLDGTVEGDPQAVISGIAGIREAQKGDLSFIANPRYAAAAAVTKATAVVVAEDWGRPCSATLIRVKNPDKAFAEAAYWFAPPPIIFKPGVHPTALVANNVTLGKDVHIGPYCVIEDEVKIGARTVICAACYLGHKSIIGEDCKFYPHVTIRESTKIGSRVIIHNSTVIGSDGFGYVQEGAIRKKIPQIGIVVIGDDVEIGANVTIDRARFGQTRIGNGVKIDNLVQIAHNVTIGDNSVIVAQVGISGSTSIGDRSILAGQVGIVGHLEIGSDVIVMAQSGVTKDLPSKAIVFGSPAIPHDKAAAIRAHTMRLPDLKAKIAFLEERLAKLEQQLSKKI